MKYRIKSLGYANLIAFLVNNFMNYKIKNFSSSKDHNKKVKS